MRNEDKLELQVTLDIGQIRKTIEASKNLQEDHEVFKSLSSLMEVKRLVSELNEVWDQAEREIKQAINDKAKALYGTQWRAIDGDGFKVTRSMSGSVYQIIDPDKVPEEMLEIKVGVKTKAVDNFIKEKSTLPEGIAYNPDRNEQLRINLK